MMYLLFMNRTICFSAIVQKVPDYGNIYLE